MLSGFSIVRNAIKLDFPIVPAIHSLLEVCDEVVVNVGKSEDETRDLVASVKDPRVRILDTEWDFTKKNIMLSIETQRAMDACRGSWGIYIQADEVLRDKIRLNTIIAKCCGKTVEQVTDDTERDRYLTAEEALAYGVVDEILHEDRKKKS